MKICFLLQRRFAYLGNNLAIVLKEKYGIHDFCGYVYLRSSYDFLKNQKDIRYSTLLLDEEIQKQYKNEKIDINYLRWLEKKYGIPNLWPYITVDRIVMYNQLVREYPYNTPPFTHGEMLSILQVTAKAVISFLETEKPDVLIVSVVAGLASTLLYHIAKIKGITTYILHPILKDMTSVSEDHEDIFSVNSNQNPEPLLLIKAKEYILLYRNQPVSYVPPSNQKKQTNRREQMNFLLPANLKRIILWFFKSLKIYFTSKEKNDYSYTTPWEYVKDGLKRKVRNMVGVNDLYDSIDSKDDYAFFPLHMEPESSLLYMAPFKINQIEAIRQIARSLPVGYKVYVKEHPLMVKYRPRAYYKELKKIPNVKLIDPTIIGFELIKNAKIITVISGSAGWEATLLKKPVITFGKTYYNQLSFVKKCRAYEDLPYLIKEQLENFHYNEQEMEIFLAKIFSSSANHVDISALWESPGDSRMQQLKALEPLADLIAEKLNLKPINLNPGAANQK